MPENFDSAITRIVGKRVTKELLELRFGENEKKILRFFFDERLKVRKRLVPKFVIYAYFCDSLEEHKWFSTMQDIDVAIENLELLEFIKKSESKVLEQEYRRNVLVSAMDGNTTTKGLKDFVGNARESYELTTTGLELLLLWHPSLALHLKAWIAIMPPWIVLIGSIAGGIGALWKVIELILKLH